jgi:hypothetical protein
MVDSARLGDVVDECAARSSELVVEDDASGEAEEALEDAFPDPGNGAGAVAFECEEVVAGPVNDGAESVEVGVHRGLQVDGALDTADFGLSAHHPSNTAQAVESII